MADDTRAAGAAGRVIVLDVVGLRPSHLDAGLAPNLAALLEGRASSLRPPFPAVTVPVQTTLATGQSPGAHGDVANGVYDRERDEVEFWGRAAADRDRIWEAASDQAGLTTGVLFFQHLIGTTADVAVTPSPIEDEDNNLLEMNCWTNPDGFYDELEAEYGHFPLHNYWGPMAGDASSEWILTAARASIERYDPDMLWVYVPHLDYDAQRHGPGSPAAHEAVETVDELVGEFLDWLRSDDRWPDTVVNVVGEYGFQPVDTPVFPNRALREAGLLAVTPARDGGDEVDLAASDAFAMVDHQVAHVYAESGAVEAAREVLAGLDGVDEVLDRADTAAYDIEHPNTGDLVLVAAPDAWFQYYWWTDHDDAPYYATDMDIHAKPGFDPCELFMGETGLASLDPTKVGGSHGRTDEAGFGFYGLGGPAAPTVALDDGPVDAREVAPTVADLLGVDDVLDSGFERSSLL
jgi:predicted AlkP superfamily pyrophosphatase or phosphodiesterase